MTSVSESQYETPKQSRQQQQEQPSNDFVIPFDTSSLGDVPTSRDGIGFSPYVNALASFLASPKTRAPLTVSIEGPWGTGKSSFMLQIAERLIGSARPDQIYCVWFNAWRCEKDEAVWASFALELIRQIHAQVPFKTRVYSNLKLSWARAKWGWGFLYIIQALIFISALFLCFGYVFFHKSDLTQILKSINSPKTPFVFGAVYILWVAFGVASKVYSKDITYQLTRLANDPGYVAKTAFSQRFGDDLKSIISSYTDKRSKIYIFIDDLDRADVPRSAEIMKAINLLLGLEESNMFFIIGLDREMVAAGIAAQYQSIIPYIAAGRSSTVAETQDLPRIGIDYGYAFLEKFIQIPFRVPSIDERLIGRWVQNLFDYESESAHSDIGTARGDSLAGRDPSAMARVVSEVAGHLKFTPRRLKQYVNVLRLQILIAFYIGLIDEEGDFIGSRRKQGSSFDLKRLALFSALVLRWPRLVPDLIADPELLREVATKAEDQMAGRSKRWFGEPGFKEALQIGDAYSLDDVDLSPLLMIMPDASVRASRARRNTRGIVAAQ